LIHFYKRMDFETAKSQFMNFSQTIASDADRFHFFQWLGKEVLPEFEHQTVARGSPSKDRIRRNSEGVLPATVMLDKIAGDIRARVPLEAVMPTETIVHPTLGEDSTLTSVNSVHLDAFLYDEEGEEALVQEGLLSRSYCQDCGSRNIEDLTFITHSCSKERLEYIFCGVLPPLDGKTVIDIGSRIGAVLYGAYFYSRAAKIIGVEMNTELCKVQGEMVQMHKLEDRVQVVEGDMCNLGGLIRSGDVIILNNVFDWFMLPQLQVKMWQFLRTTLATGCLIVSIPSLEASLGPLNTGIDLSTWVRAMDMFDKSIQWDKGDSQVETTEVCLYQVINGS
jgi:hypothetical protein